MGHPATLRLSRRVGTGESGPPVQKVGAIGLARVGGDEYDKDVLI